MKNVKIIVVTENTKNVEPEYIAYTLADGTVKKEYLEANCDYHGNNELRFSEYRLTYYGEMLNSWEVDANKHAVKVEHIRDNETLTKIVL